ncbi:hypothetical protein [Salinispora mooreana]|uniref:hypothetical protein n=1 Tax=Salinispora mooreana TaxID=999545 RepID=UPI00037C146B|nr:hypothetical protein [Salinispora mooreana]
MLHRSAVVLSAQRLARVVAHWAHVLPQLDPGGSTVSAEDDQYVQHWIFCDRLIVPVGLRCRLRPDHAGACARHGRRR